MHSILISAVVAVIVFVLFLLLTRKRISSEGDTRTRGLLDQISQEAARQNAQNIFFDTPLLKEQISAKAAWGAFASLPGAQSTYELLLKAGFEKKTHIFLLATVGLFIAVSVGMHNWGIRGVAIALVVAFFLPRQFLKHRIASRNAKFIELFPDAIDMIVRSVRSGYPFTTAMRMIAENMESPVSDEFTQVLDEVSHGRTIPESLSRMALRIGEADLNFFVVVLSVQQETGGSLAEVLANLSKVIRSRRQLRLKIKAMTAEGRITSYVLGGLPVLVCGALYSVSPDYMRPLFDSLLGQMIFCTAAVLMVLAIWVVRIMAEIDI